MLIEIRNFKGIYEHKLEAAHMPVEITGSNGWGKTSMLEAIRYGLTGKLPKDHLKRGEKEGYVKITFDDADKTVIERRFFKEKASQVRINGRATTATSVQKVICDIMGCDAEKLDIFTSFEKLNDLMSGNLGAFFMGFIPEEFDFEKLKGLVEFTEAETTKIIKDKLLPKTFRYDVCESVYKKLFDERAALKKELQTLNAKYNFAEEFDEPFYKSEKEIAIDEEKALAAKHGRAAFEKAFKNYSINLEKYKARLTRYNLLVSQLEKLGEPAKVDKTAIEKAEIEIIEENENLRFVISQKIAANFQKESSEKILKALDSDVCPISACLKCKTDKTAIKEEIANAVSLAAENLKSCEEQENIHRKKIQALTEVCKNLRESAEQFQTYLNLQQRIKDNEPGEEPIAPEKPAEEFDYELFEDNKKAFFAYYEKEDAKKIRDTFETKIALCDSLLKKFAPKGAVVNAILSYYCDIFDEEAAKFALSFGFKIKFIAENGLSLFIKKGETLIPFSSLSRGEQFVVGIAVYAVLNSLLGTGIIFMDNFNDLDKINAYKAEELLKTLCKEYDFSTVFVAGTEI